MEERDPNKPMENRHMKQTKAEEYITNDIIMILTKKIYCFHKGQEAMKIKHKKELSDFKKRAVGT